MKRTISILLSLLMLLSSTPLSGLIAFADETETSGMYGDFTWTYDEDNNSLTFYGTGCFYIYQYKFSDSLCNAISNSQELHFGEGISSLSFDSLYNYGANDKYLNSIKRIYLPKTFVVSSYFLVSRFYFFSSLEELLVDEENKSLCSENGVIFSKDKTILYNYPVNKSGTTYTIPDSVKSLNKYAFYMNKNLQYVENDHADIGDYCFAYCESLNYIDLDEGVHVGKAVFNYCTSLNEVHISKEPVNVSVFAGCSKLKKVVVDSDNPQIISINNVVYTKDKSQILLYPGGLENTSYTVLKGVKTIPGGVFACNENLQTIVLPTGVTTIADNAFESCTNLSSINLPEGITEIGYSAFFKCSSLEELILPSSLEKIGGRAFYLSALKHLVIPECVNNIEQMTFGDINIYKSQLETLTILNKNCNLNYQCGINYKTKIYGLLDSTAQSWASTYGNDFVCLCSDFTENHDYEETVVPPTADEKGYTLYTCKTCGYNYKSNVIKADEIVYSNGGRTLVSYSSELTDDTFVVPDTVNVISDDAFNNEYLKTVVVSSNVKVIGNSAFENCPNLESVEFSDDAQLEQIESSAFAGTNIQTVVVPESVKSVKSKAFANCIKLDSFDVEENVEEIADDAFENSNNVTLICPYQSASYKFASRKKIPTIAYSRIPDQKYTGKPICPEVAIYDVNGNRMYNGMDFYFTYKNNINVGTAYTVVNGIGAYNGRVKNLKFKIVKAAAKPSPVSASTLKVSLARTSYTYDGGAKKPNVIVKTKAGKTVSSSNYTASYSGARKNVGAYTVTIKFKNSYTGTVKRTFRIYPKATYITKLVAGKKSFTAKWSKQTAQVTGYQVQYCVRSNFKGAKTVTVGSAKTASKKIANVAGNKKYYVRVRTYKTVGKTRYYSSWSKAKAVKTK